MSAKSAKRAKCARRVPDEQLDALSEADLRAVFVRECLGGRALQVETYDDEVAVALFEHVNLRVVCGRDWTDEEENSRKVWWVQLTSSCRDGGEVFGTAESPSFARAAVIAMIRATRDLEQSIFTP